MRVLVVTAEPISAAQLRGALSDGADPSDAEVMVVAPALQESPIKFWLSDVDEAIERAQDVWRQSVEQLEREGVSASGDTGESDPALAIQDALATFAADRIVLFTDPASGRYHEDLDEGELQERFGVPVTRSGSAA